MPRILTSTVRRCIACGSLLPPGSNAGRMYCPKPCRHRLRPAPAVYRYVCPDGRSYVGSTADHRIRDRHGLSRSNSLIDEAFVTPPVAMPRRTAPLVRSSWHSSLRSRAECLDLCPSSGSAPGRHSTRNY